MPKQKSKVRDISEVKKKNFDEKSKLKTVQLPLDHVKSIDLTKFPLCRSVLDQHLKRAWFITKLWRSTSTTYPASGYNPIDYDWKLSECHNYLEIKWIEDQVVETWNDR